MTRAVAEDYSSSSCILLRLLSSASGRDLAPAGGVVCDVAVSPVSLSAVTRCDFFSSVSSLPPCSDSQQGPASYAANAAAAAALPPGSFNDGAPVEPPRRPAHLRRVPAAGLRRGFSERTEGHREGRRRCYVACALIQKKERDTTASHLREPCWSAHAARMDITCALSRGSHTRARAHRNRRGERNPNRKPNRNTRSCRCCRCFGIFLEQTHRHAHAQRYTCPLRRD